MTIWTYSFSEALNVIKDDGLAHRVGSPTLLRRTSEVSGIIVNDDTGEAWAPTMADIMAEDWRVFRRSNDDLRGGG